MRKSDRKALAALLTVCLLLGLMPTAALAAEADLTTISSAEELKAFAASVNGGQSYKGKTVTLTADLDLNGENWTPIGNSSCAFEGTFDGGFHTIHNLTITTTNRYCGLFGKLENATIQNLGIENANIESSANDVAALAGNARGGTISRCYVTGTVKGRGAVSGILGSTHSSSYTTEINSCYARVAIVQNSTYTDDLAGISGWNEATSVKITNSYSACTGEKRPIAGWSDGSPVTNAQFVNTYFDKTLSPDFSDEAGRTDLGKASTELKAQAAFTGWDFDTVWTIAPEKNGGYPYLRGFTPGLGGAPGSVAVRVVDGQNDPVTDASVKLTLDETDIPLSHEDNGVYSGIVTTSGATYDVYVNGTKVGTVTQTGSGAATAAVTAPGDEPPAGDHIHDGVTFTVWSQGDSLPTQAGNYYLTSDVTLADSWNTPEDKAVHLCLNGHSITGPDGKAAVHSVSELTLLNCQEREAVITGGTAVEARLGSLTLFGPGLIKLVGTGRYGCALDIGIQRLDGPTLVATIPDTVTLEVNEGASSALNVHESTNNKVRISGAKVIGNNGAGVTVDYGSVEITGGTVTGMPALYTHWNGAITVSGGRIATDTGGEAMEVMGPVSVTGAPTIFGPAVIIYSRFSSGIQHGQLDAQGYTGERKIDLMIEDTFPSAAKIGDTVVTNGKLSQFNLVSNTFSLVAEGSDLKLGDPSAQPSHTHTWATMWVTDETAHWHTCTADGCNITNYAACGETGAAYAEHVYDDDQDATCNTCGYERAITPPEPDGAEVSGTVTDNSAPVQGATVKLVKGREVLAETTTDESGAYTFANVAPGSYNVVATKADKTKTALVIVTGEDVAADIHMPSSQRNSLLEVKENTPAVVVGGLDYEVEQMTIFPSATLTMTVESKAEAQADNAAAIKELAGSGKTLEYLDIALTLDYVSPVDGPGTATLNGTTIPCTIVIPFDKTGKKDIAVYRFHDGAAEALSTNPNGDGEYFTVGNDAVTVYAKKFSTYAIGYTPETATPSPGGSARPNQPNVQPERPTVSALPFVDVAETDWFCESVKYMFDKKLMEGTDEAHFSPALTTSRAMIAAILWRLEDSPAMGGGKSGTFPDVPDNVWYTDAVEWAAANGVVKGYGNGYFGPDDLITREQLAAMLYRYAQLKGKDAIENGTEILRFADTGDVADWAKEAMTWAVDKGVLTGKGGNILAPAGLASRGEVAAVFTRYCENNK